MDKIIQRLPGKILAFLVISLVTMLGIIGIHGAIASSKTGAVKTVGWVENTSITGVDAVMKAKLDTGATTASINAETPDDDVESGGLVKFYFVDSDGNKTLFERPLVRWVKIKGKDRRPVVEMNFCVAGAWVEGEASLADRDNFNYPILVGRNLLEKGQLVVDSRRSFVAFRQNNHKS